jgi:hypothetical protein
VWRLTCGEGREGKHAHPCPAPEQNIRCTRISVVAPARCDVVTFGVTCNTCRKCAPGRSAARFRTKA